ncbi:IS30 family transposase [Streptococcus loxodontisalivarius]|uniref:IS30 family transposase n=1 Tax=Streptococcus loxodontisalivarius TaxID=1349415 RepID=A0ABS2PUS6_9STRE|nr:IS30 family transposase [Streptococcus loxodontisalivarius]MBM7643809.1 IS30 family transposase [Streptococcus loxodontisalivarius]
MQEYYTPKGKHLTITERHLIERWLQEGHSHREIARRLGKAPQTINNEIKRGLVRQVVRKGRFKKVYSAEFAQNAYEKNRKRSVKPVYLTKDVKEKILHYWKQKYSPEMMVKAKGIPVPVSTIYYWFHQGHLGLSPKDLLYPRKVRAPKKIASPDFKPAGKSIEERPKVINQRLRVGDYEIDTVLQTRERNPCLLTLTDRKTRYEIIRLIPSKSASAVNQALSEILKEHPIKSITADNGTEFSRLSEVFNPENIYYAHPYSSWERGTNENHNRLIRRWLPKGSKNATKKQIAFIENWINNYPKKILSYKSPNDVLLNG